MMSKNAISKDDVAPVQSPDGEEAHMDREGADAQAQGLGYEFEVKEQDRWLPIANGAYTVPYPLLLSDLRAASLHLHVDGLLPTGGPGCRHTLQSRARVSSARATQSRRVPERPQPCSRRHVVLVSTLVHFPATNYAQEHKQQCYCVGC